MTAGLSVPDTDSPEPARGNSPMPEHVPYPAANSRGWVGAALRVPLVAKIVGANFIIVLAALVVEYLEGPGAPSGLKAALLLGGMLGVSLLVNVALVLVALKPLEDLEDTAQRIWRGDIAARVPVSKLADANLRRIGGALNALLDGLTSDRARMRALASQVISAGDRERAALARELHDSTAQTIAALLLELAVVAGEIDNPRMASRMERIRRIASDVLDEVKMLAHTVHPRVLDDLGLAAALRLLAREAEERARLRVVVEVDDDASALPPVCTSVLYRVAQEAVNNAIRHGKPETITMRLAIRDGIARLEVDDDGVGFNVLAVADEHRGMGLFTMRERTLMVGGALEVLSGRGEGTRVIATVPIDGAVPSADAR